MRARGVTTERHADYRAASRVIVIQRAHGWCEGIMCRNSGYELAHAFGRGHIIKEPLASMPAMTYWLCRTCHRRMDVTDPVFQHVMRWVAVSRACVALGMNYMVMSATYDDPVHAAHAIERTWDGVMPT